MNKYFTLVIAVMLTAIIACSSSDSPDRFLGEWQSLVSSDRSHMIIQKRGDNITITEGKKELPASYDKENKKLTFNIGFGAMDIIYLEDKEHLLVSGFGEYAKVEK